MSAEPQRTYTSEEYLTLERESETRNEYLNGEIFAMSGASRGHNLIGTNIVGALHTPLKRQGCEQYASDMRVRVPATGLYTYPDVVVVCGEPEFEDGEGDTLINPNLLIEILSPSTEDYDRGRKFAHYRSLPSLQAYLLVAQDHVHVELSTRHNNSFWMLWETDDLKATLEIPVIGVTLELADIYDRLPGIDS